MEGGVLFEHGHRMVAATIGLMTILMAVWTWRIESRRWVRNLGLVMLAVVIVQGLLGGLTVLMKLPDAVSISHAGLAQIFFSLTVVMAAVTSPRYRSVTRYPLPVTRLQGLSIAAVAIVYAQIILGAIVRHKGAGLAIADFPMAQGRIIPEFTSSLVAWHFAHRVFALLVAGHVVMCAIRALRSRESWLTTPAWSLIALIAAQILLGGLTIWSGRAVAWTTAHVAAGALILVTSVVLALRVSRLAAAGNREAVAEPVMEGVA